MIENDKENISSINRIAIRDDDSADNDDDNNNLTNLLTGFCFLYI
jgi:hypothetical protein